MSPFLFSSGDAIFKRIKMEQEVEEYLKAKGSSTPAPAIDMEDDSSLSIDNSSSNESHDVQLDQSNNGFSFVNIHWASFSTGLSSVLAVVLAGLFIAGCCYFRGRRQRQSRARHTQLLHALSSTSRHVSSDTPAQSGRYPGTAVPEVNHPVVRYSAAPSSASCGLPGCSTSYERHAVPAISYERQAVPAISCERQAVPAISHDAFPAISFIDRSPGQSAIDFKPSAPRQTGISSLHG